MDTLSTINDDINLERGCVEQSVGRLGHIGGMQAIVEGIVFDVVILEGHHEGHKGLGWYGQRFEQIPGLEGCVGDAGQRSVVA